MTQDIALVLAIVVAAVVLFVTERLRVDLVALLVLGALALTKLVTPSEALSGFSSPAVVTVWAVFILSGGLAQTGVASVIGRQIMRLAGQGEMRLLLVIMLTAGALSAFMNNVGVAALLLPVVLDIARRSDRPPSRLLMPLAIGALLGGLTTLIGTPPNILVSDALREAGQGAFGFFDFAPVGLSVLVAGVAYMVLVGRHLLPTRNVARETAAGSPEALEKLYRLQERLFMVRLPANSALAGKTLEESQIGAMLGLNLLAILRQERPVLSPAPYEILRGGDRLVVAGRTDQLAELRQHRVDVLERVPLSLEGIQAAGIDVAEATLLPDSALNNQTLEETGFRRAQGVNVLAVRRDGQILQDRIQNVPLRAGDHLLVQGPTWNIAQLGETPGLALSAIAADDVLALHGRLLLVRIPSDSTLAGKTLEESRLGEIFGLTILSIIREGRSDLLPTPEQRIEAGDVLLVQGSEEDLGAIRGLEELELEESPASLEALASAQAGLTEVVLSPHTTLSGKTLRELHFRDKYGLTVVAIWRGGRAYRTSLGEMALRFGDALLLFGPRERLQVLGSEPDFVVLRGEAQGPLRVEKAPLAVGIMAAVLLPVLLGWQPIAISAVVGAAVMVVTRCLTMDEAYRFIEWPAVFLIAGMLPLGIAMENSGAAEFLAENMVAVAGQFGPLAILAGLFILSVLASQVMPNAAVAVLMAPIAINSAADLDMSAQAFMMGVAIAASASFLSPVSHPANVLIMGPGGYRFSDYLRVGLPLTLIVLVVVLIVLPLVWPLQ